MTPPDRTTAPSDEPAALGRTAERAIVGGGVGLILLAAVAAAVLNVVYGEAAFAERLISGIAGCL